MKRTLFAAGMLSSAAVGFCTYLPYKWSLVIAAVLFGACVLMFFFLGKLKSGFSVIICLVLTSIVLSNYYLTTLRGPVSCERLIGKSSVITATVMQEPEHKGGNSYLYYVKTDSVSSPSAPQNLKLCFVAEGNPLSAMDKITAEVTFDSFDLDKYTSWYGEGIYLETKCHKLEKTGVADRSFQGFAAKISSAVRSNIAKHLPYEISGILIGLVTSGTTHLDAATYAAFKGCGITHMVAVSGMHMAVVCSAVGTLLSLVGIRKRYRFLAILPLLVLYAAVSGFSPSSVRAVIMIAAVFSGNLFLRRGDGLNSLGATAVGMLIVSPYLIYNVSFLLSFSAMAGILLSQPIQRRIEAGIVQMGGIGVLLKYICSTFVASVAAVIATFPVIAIIYGWISTVSVLANLAISFVIDVLLVFGLITVGAALLVGDCPIIVLLYKIIEIPLYYVRGMAIFISNLPYSYIKFNISQVSFAIAFSFALAAAVMLVSKKEWPRVLKMSGYACGFAISAIIFARII